MNSLDHLVAQADADFAGAEDAAALENAKAKYLGKTGQITEYPMPRFTNMRRAFVDNSTTPVTFWVGNTHGASIVKLEPLN